MLTGLGALLAILALGACQLPPSPEDIRLQQQEEARQRARAEAARANLARERRRRGQQARRQREQAERKPVQDAAAAPPGEDALPALATAGTEPTKEDQDAADAPLPDFVEIYEGRDGTVFGCRTRALVEQVHRSTSIGMSARFDAIERGGCLPAMQGAAWVQAWQALPYRLMALVPIAADRASREPVFLWFHEDDMRPTGRRIPPPPSLR